VNYSKLKRVFDKRKYDKLQDGDRMIMLQSARQNEYVTRHETERVRYKARDTRMTISRDRVHQACTI